MVGALEYLSAFTALCEAHLVSFLQVVICVKFFDYLVRFLSLFFDLGRDF